MGYIEWSCCGFICRFWSPAQHQSISLLACRRLAPLISKVGAVAQRYSLSAVGGWSSSMFLLSSIFTFFATALYQSFLLYLYQTASSQSNIIQFKQYRRMKHLSWIFCGIVFFVQLVPWTFRLSFRLRAAWCFRNEVSLPHTVSDDGSFCSVDTLSSFFA